MKWFIGILVVGVVAFAGLAPQASGAFWRNVGRVFGGGLSNLGFSNNAGDWLVAAVVGIVAFAILAALFKSAMGNVRVAIHGPPKPSGKKDKH